MVSGPNFYFYLSHFGSSWWIKSGKLPVSNVIHTLGSSLSTDSVSQVFSLSSRTWVFCVRGFSVFSCLFQCLFPRVYLSSETVSHRNTTLSLFTLDIQSFRLKIDVEMVSCRNTGTRSMNRRDYGCVEGVNILLPSVLYRCEGRPCKSP